ncbi:MAG TPA: elongation factor P [Syntrophales bacterium]|jgi:elongation factor P|nr:elongation factor P [Syntrophales bacterium]HON22795.1 elongation factor P [Syntrophales bacterium]HOU76788.1 elongation factor P [Syntrophales bacterium]HPC31911.1 elongation factor P [Syntrophales bacterium]HQG33573.1 elongation factor P [Syntrophales bacterium]
MSNFFDRSGKIHYGAPTVPESKIRETAGKSGEPDDGAFTAGLFPEGVAMYSASDLRKNLRIKMEDEPYVITEFNFTKPGKGQALYRCKLKNMISGAQFERTFRSVDVFEPADLQEKKMQFLYEQEGKYCFMDNETYEQILLTEDQVGDGKNYLIENIEVEVLLFEDRPLGVSLPNFVDLVVTKAEPWARGDSVSGNTKPVTVQTGYVLQVPPFIEEGEKIRIDTRTGEYLTRVKD